MRGTNPFRTTKKNEVSNPFTSSHSEFQNGTNDIKGLGHAEGISMQTVAAERPMNCQLLKMPRQRQSRPLE
jgi:hypothetical protein